MRKWSLWIGLVLLVAFGVFATLMYLHFRGRFEKNDDLIGQLASAEILEEAPLITGDWPQWRGLRRDGHGEAVTVAGKWPRSGLKPEWTVAAGQGFSAPAVVAGRVYLHTQQDDQDVIRCVMVDNGKEVWKQTAPPSGSFDHSRGPNSSPCVAGKQLYTVSLVGRVQCRSTADGKLLWEKDLAAAFGATTPRWGVSFSPLVEGQRLILNPGAPGAAVVAVNRDTGDELWRSGNDQVGYSSPLVATIAGQKLVLMFTGYALTAMRLDNGKEVFRHPWKTDFQVNPAMPIVFHARQGDRVHDYVFITSGYGYGCGLFHLRPRNDGTLALETVYTGDNLASHYGSPVRVGDHVYGFHEAELLALNLRTGEVRWKVNGYKKGTPVRPGRRAARPGRGGQAGSRSRQTG
jgi:outer membrane protein assembly factor BamB